MYMLWNGHSKTWNKKHFVVSAYLSEGFINMFGLGFDFKHTNWVAAQKYNHDLSLDLNILWWRMWFTLSFGGKPKLDAMIKRLKEDK